MQRNSVQSLIGERASAHVKKSTRIRVNLCMPCKQGFNYSTQNGSESRFRDRCFFFCRCAMEHIMVCSTVREDARAIVLRHRLLIGRRNFGKLK